MCSNGDHNHREALAEAKAAMGGGDAPVDARTAAGKRRKRDTGRFSIQVSTVT